VSCESATNDPGGDEAQRGPPAARARYRTNNRDKLPVAPAAWCPALHTE
jgi:hypothetical protein